MAKINGNLGYEFSKQSFNSDRNLQMAAVIDVGVGSSQNLGRETWRMTSRPQRRRYRQAKSKSTRVSSLTNGVDPLGAMAKNVASMT